VKAESERTEVIQREGEVLEAVLAFLTRARSRLDICSSSVGPRTGEEFVDSLRAARRRGVRPRLLTEVNIDNMKAMNTASRYLDIRHISGLRGNSWAVSGDEYVSSLSFGEFKASYPVIFSNANTLVVEHQSIFDALWNHGEPLRDRILDLEAGTGLPEVDIIRDPTQVRELYLSLAERAKDQILLVLPTSMAFRRDSDIGMVDLLERKASEGVKVRILTPVDPWVITRLPQPAQRTKGIIYRTTVPAETAETITLLVVDRFASLSIEERAPGEQDFTKSVGSAILATREPRVRQSTRFFERLWTENELREAEAKARKHEETSRKRAELMQDILTHDIRNFNQVARLNAELLGEEVTDRESKGRVSAILRAVDGSTTLIERAKKLGSILSAGEVEVEPISLRWSFERSMSLVKKSNPSVKLKLKSNLTGSVLADGLLDEVFVNVLSNAVKYSGGNSARIEVLQEQAELRWNPHGRGVPCWKVSISDHGRGIPDSQKASVFKRYLETAKGSGLGLSIVHALVTDRFRGRVLVRDRVAGDYSKGTTVEIWLPRA
jgi:signal transduction histidine kinase